ncbi:unnamed protein product [Mytilus coruscus]|uniref:Uncharacterized protein n=1 Tax=Mytilus coruscus TaxID=42192 RepID=A0A6J8BA85_MYTCO|nr:unnamed protein product [Mytilus coruscus]
MLNCTVILRVDGVIAAWVPTYYEFIQDAFVVGNKGQRGVLKYPTKKGYVQDGFGLPENLWAIRIKGKPSCTLESDRHVSVVLSAIIRCKDEAINARSTIINEKIENLCKRNCWMFMDNSNINCRHLRDHVHLNEEERLKLHLNVLKLYEGETSHSSRRGCAITLHYAGVNDEPINQHVGWGTKHMVDHYANVGN